MGLGNDSTGCNMLLNCVQLARMSRFKQILAVYRTYICHNYRFVYYRYQICFSQKLSLPKCFAHQTPHVLQTNNSRSQGEGERGGERIGRERERGRLRAHINVVHGLLHWLYPSRARGVNYTPRCRVTCNMNAS